MTKKTLAIHTVSATHIQAFFRGSHARKMIGPLIKHNICPITYTELRIYNATITDCGHSFEQTALDIWLKKHDTCPLCRTVVSSSADKAPPISSSYQSRDFEPIYMCVLLIEQGEYKRVCDIGIALTQSGELELAAVVGYMLVQKGAHLEAQTVGLTLIYHGGCQQASMLGFELTENGEYECAQHIGIELAAANHYDHATCLAFQLTQKEAAAAATPISSALIKHEGYHQASLLGVEFVSTGHPKLGREILDTLIGLGKYDQGYPIDVALQEYPDCSLAS